MLEILQTGKIRTVGVDCLRTRESGVKNFGLSGLVDRQAFPLARMIWIGGQQVAQSVACAAESAGRCCGWRC
jgi:hypothetical protein